MKYLRYIYVLIFIVLSISCSKFRDEGEHSIALDKAIETMNNAVEPCTAKTMLRQPPNLEDLEAMSTFSDETIFHYVTYRYYINHEICLMQNGAITKEYLAIVAFNEDIDYFTRSEAEQWLKKLITMPLLTSMDYINNLPESERKALREIDYLNSIFDALVVSDKLREYKHGVLE